MLAGLGGLAAGALLVGKANAGPLDPPAGPIAPTPGPEPRTAINATNTRGDANSLFKITQPGSYYLTGNVSGVIGKHGIKITASGVTLDLNGFDLLGVPGSLAGVAVTVSNLTNIAVLNGSVRNWEDQGVDLGIFNTFNCRVHGVLSDGNTGTGILVSAGSTVTDCSALNNTANGIQTAGGCTVSNCTAFTNNFSGIVTGIGCTVTNCSALGNTENGINTVSACTVSNCSVYLNTGSGISVGSGSMVSDCTSQSNRFEGILCTSRCAILGNTCSRNGNNGDGAGIQITDFDNRIESNNCTGNDWGIRAENAGNFIARNSCSGNTTLNWDIAPGNICLVVQATAAGAINGNSGGVAPGSTDPNANFTY